MSTQNFPNYRRPIGLNARIVLSLSTRRGLLRDTGAAGLSICKSRRIDCVVSELDLPDMSGFQVLVELVPRVTHPEVAVIILTRIDVTTFSKHALKNGAQAYLVKSPTSCDDLDKVIPKA